MYVKGRSRANIDANPLARLGSVGVLSSVTAGAAVYHLAERGAPRSWSVEVWLGGWIVLGALGGSLLKLRPLTIGLCAAGLAQAVYLVLFADHGDGDGLWAVGLFFIPVGAVFAYGAATVAAFVRRQLARSRDGDPPA
ncbi:MAG: hypothetical protein M3198_14890 [Actinomycetota bacterium]|nr:hypothetical protein [Actinomycetota bacterium]